MWRFLLHWNIRTYSRLSKVLLYNFFQDSTVDVSQWRLVLNTQHGRQGNTLSTPRFNELHHAGVCSEVRSHHITPEMSSHTSLVEVPICSNHKSAQKFVDRRLFRKGRTYASESLELVIYVYNAHMHCRNFGSLSSRWTTVPRETTYPVSLCHQHRRNGRPLVDLFFSINATSKRRIALREQTCTAK